MSISKNSISSPASSQPAPQQASQPAPHQASPEQVEQVIASALPLTGMIPVVEAPASPDAQEPQQPRVSGFAEAMRTAGVVMAGLFFVGIGLGVVIHSYGFPMWLAVVLPGIVFAGSVEFVLLDMMSLHASLVSIALMTLLVNSRHLMYGLSYPIERVRHPLAKFYSVYTLTDEAYVLNSGPDRHTLRGSRILWIHAGMQVSVICGTLLGYVLGVSFLSELKGLGFVMTALFAILTVDAYRESKDRLTAVIALVAAAAGLLIAPQSMLVVSMVVYLSLLVARYAVQKRRGTLPEHMLVADHDGGSEQTR
ncbi:AzlC family ABC transporter permease [Rothia mucilaginosa]|uniref:AzlC family ABC transporter permease n=1 Tax=Rothia mucilaginosa TaxID=43675 RepID=UPI0026F2352C|nr:AzlC family ABC transporter permease [Rothia mucilaginosa]